MAQKLWDFGRRNCGTGRRNYGILQRAQKGAIVVLMLGIICIRGAMVIKPRAAIPYPAVVLWTGGTALFAAAFLVAVRSYVGRPTRD